MLTSHELFGFMSPDLANEIIVFVHDTDKQTYRATLDAVAKARHVRTVFMERQPKPQRYAAIISTLSKPGLEQVAGGLLRVWLVKKHRTMLADFVTALGIENEEGVVEDLPATMDDAKLKSAVESLLTKYPPETVAVYLNAFNEMNEANWPNLKNILESEPRLQLGAHS
ncbi:MAG TPA: hypothetical protein VHG71_10645 [Verrucomicrobiae bacterium]|nr:hypothetical protein [Verrucomicrobiae bacterium]